MASRASLPPGSPESSLRQLKRLVDNPFPLFHEAYREYGPIFTMRVLGQHPWVMIGDPDAVRTIFRSSADELHADADAIKYLLGPHTVLFRDGESHRRERRILTPPFKHERMVVYAERMLRASDDAIDALHDGQSLVTFDLVQQISLRVIVECVFGVSAPERRDRLAALFARHLTAMQTGPMAFASMALGGERLRKILGFGTNLRKGRAKVVGALPSHASSLVRFFDTKAEMDAMLRDELARCRAEPSDRDDVLAMLARATYEDGQTMSDDGLLDELFALLIGGHETSAITLSWALHFLLSHPEAMARARAEIREVFGDAPVEAKAAERMRFIPAIIDETMRLRPVATSVPRKLAVPMKLGEFELPVGTRVFPSPAVLHFREDLWPDATAFKPERFLEERPSPFQYLPFGGGSRACLGRPFAQVEMRLILAELLQRVDFRLAEHADTKAVLRGMLTGPSDGVPVVVTRVRPKLGTRETVATAA